MKKIISSIVALTLVLVILGLPNQSAKAAIQEYINTSNGNYYIYDYNALIASYESLIIDESSSGSALFNYFTANFNTVAVIDNKTGKVVDYNKLIEVYTDHVVANKTFDPNAYTESSDAVEYGAIPTTVKRVTLSGSNQVVITEEVLAGPVSDFEVIGIE